MKEAQPSPYLREPPAAPEMEEAALGSALMSTSAAGEVVTCLEESDFTQAARRYLFRAVRSLLEGREDVDPLTVAEWLRRRELLDACGGMAYILSLEPPTAANVSSYVKAVADAGELRRRIAVLAAGIEAAYEPACAVDKSREALERDLARAGRRRSQGDIRPVRPVAMRLIDRILSGEKPAPGILSGLHPLDRVVGGWRAPDLILLGGRSGMGKSGTMCCFALAAAEAGVGTGILSLEMTEDRIMQRMTANRAGVNGLSIEWQELNPEEQQRASAAAGRIGDLPLFFADRKGQGLADVRANARHLVRQEGCRLLFLDHLHRIDRDSGAESERVWISRVAVALKNLAGDLDVPIIALAQLNRDVDTEGDKRPMLRHLRESGALESEADLVLFPYRPSYYARKAAIAAGTARSTDPEDFEIIIGKNREGEELTIPLRYIAAYQRIFAPEDRYGEPDGGRAGY